MSCGVCGDPGRKRLYCGSCAGYLILRSRVNLAKAQGQITTLRKEVEDVFDVGPTPRASTASKKERSAPNNTDGEPHVAGFVLAGQLESRLNYLRTQLGRTQQAILTIQGETEKLKQSAAANGRVRDSRASSAQFLSKTSLSDYSAESTATQAAITELERDYRHTLHQSMALQARCCKDLLEIYALKKKRRRNEYDVVLGFDTIPSLGHLSRYQVATINSGIERIAYFITFLASYLGIQLPYELKLPQKGQPHAFAGGVLLRIDHSVKTMLRSSPADFFEYCRGLAMLALNVAFVAGRLGVPSIDVGSVPRLNQLVAQISLRLDSLLKSGHQIQVHAMVLSVDVDTVQDQIITSIDVDVNGGSAEWNIVDAPEKE